MSRVFEKAGVFTKENGTDRWIDVAESGSDKIQILSGPFSLPALTPPQARSLARLIRRIADRVEKSQ